jgi:hypothetical protein
LQKNIKSVPQDAQRGRHDARATGGPGILPGAICNNIMC